MFHTISSSRKKSSKYFVRDETHSKNEALNIIQLNKLARSPWRIKSREEFITSLSEDEKKRLGGKSKLEQQPANRYFKKKLLSDIVMHNVVCSSTAERETLLIFVHFLKGEYIRNRSISPENSLVLNIAFSYF